MRGTGMKILAVIGVVLMLAVAVKTPALINDVTKFIRDVADTI